MKSGVPAISLAVVSARAAGSSSVTAFHDAEIQDLDDVVLHPAMTQVDVGRFDVSVDQTVVMGLSQ